MIAYYIVCYVRYAGSTVAQAQWGCTLRRRNYTYCIVVALSTVYAVFLLTMVVVDCP